MKKSHNNNEQQTWDLTKYTGPGKKEYNDNGVLVAIVLTEEQEREHDRQYRQRLINLGVLTPKK